MHNKERSGRIFYRSTIEAVRKDPSTETFTLFVQEAVKTAMESVPCHIVVSAIGMGVPNVQNINGIDLAVGYEDLPPVGRFFENKSLALMGLGNAAFETGKHIMFSAIMK